MTESAADTRPIRPFGARVAIKPVDDSGYVSPGGLILDHLAKDRPDIGIVTAIANEVTTVAVGDKVVFNKYTGNDAAKETHGVLIVAIADVLAVIGEES